jgi:hypothetical protein
MKKCEERKEKFGETERTLGDLFWKVFKSGNYLGMMASAKMPTAQISLTR